MVLLLRHRAKLQRFELLRRSGQRNFRHLFEFHHPIIQLIQNGIARFGGLLRFALFLFLRGVQLGHVLDERLLSLAMLAA